MGELVFALVVAPLLIIGLVIGLTTWRWRRLETAAPPRPNELAGRDALVAGQAWNAGFVANARIARLEDRISTLEHSVPSPGPGSEA